MVAKASRSIAKQLIGWDIMQYLKILHFWAGLLIPLHAFFGTFFSRRFVPIRFSIGAVGWRESIVIGSSFTIIWAFLGTILLSLGHYLSKWPILAWWILGIILVLFPIKDEIKIFGQALSIFLKNALHAISFAAVIQAALISLAAMVLPALFSSVLFQSLEEFRLLPWIVWWLGTILILISLIVVCPDLKEVFHRGSVTAQSSFCEKIALAGIAMILASTLICAIASPPNTWDSLMYHLPRQVIWMADKSALLFHDSNLHPSITKMPPLAEYLGVQLYLLSGSDRWHNLIQWTALLMALNLLALIMGRLQWERRATLLALLAFCTVPMVYAQASSTKNDLLLTEELLAAFWIILLPGSRNSISPWIGALFGVFAGFSLLTKGTAIVFLPMVIVGSYAMLRTRKIRLTTSSVVLAGIFVLGIAGYHYAAEATTNVHTELGEKSVHVNADMSVAAMLSVLVRNLAMQFALPWEHLNKVMTGSTEFLMRCLGRPSGDPQTSFLGEFYLQYRPDAEDMVTSAPFFIGLLLLPVAGWFHWRRYRNVALPVMIVMAWGMLICFSWIFRWQPYHSRLLIPVYAFASMPMGVLLSECRPRWIATMGIVVFLLWLYPSFYSWDRPLLGSRSVLCLSEKDLRCNGFGYGDINISLRQLFEAAHPRSVFVYLGKRFNYPVYSIYQSFRLPDGNWPKIERNPFSTRSCEAVLVADTNGMPATHPEWGKKVFEQDGWQLWLDPAAAERSKRAAPGPFWGFSKFETEVGNYQGPYPPLPAFRNFYAPETSFTVPGSEHPLLLRLRIQNQPGHLSGKCHVEADGSPIRSFPLSLDLPAESLEVPLGLHPHDWRLTLRFDGGIAEKSDSKPVAARCYSLQILELSQSMP
jgi:hypothetical protein